MNILVIDLTHGGVKIAVSYAKMKLQVYAYDIYNTLTPIDKKMLDAYNVKLIGLDDLKTLNGDLKVIYPIHLPLTKADIAKYNPNLNYHFITHHKAVNELLNDWGGDVLKIEVTGVKGKTSTVFMLKEILIDYNPLILSSLGSRLYNNQKEYILKRDISITPANIKESVDLAYKLANPICGGEVKPRLYDCAIFECSLGASGIGDVGLLTNIVEDYPIADNHSTASIAKKQVFDCEIVCCQKECLDKYYSNVNHEKINSFSLNDNSSNIYPSNVTYAPDKTVIEISYTDVETKTGTVSGNLTVETFALGSHHVLNVLGAVSVCLSSDIPHSYIINGLKNYNGIIGRSNRKTVSGITIIEEINPGINTKAIEKSINMISKDDEFYISIGGDYGITCEEIDEDSLAELLNKLDLNIILTGDVGKNLSYKLNKEYLYIDDFNDIYDLAIKNKKNLLFIYRTDYRKLSER